MIYMRWYIYRQLWISKDSSELIQILIYILSKNLKKLRPFYLVSKFLLRYVNSAISHDYQLLSHDTAIKHGQYRAIIVQYRAIIMQYRGYRYLYQIRRLSISRSASFLGRRSDFSPSDWQIVYSQNFFHQSDPNLV